MDWPADIGAAEFRALSERVEAIPGLIERAAVLAREYEDHHAKLALVEAIKAEAESGAILRLKDAITPFSDGIVQPLGDGEICAPNAHWATLKLALRLRIHIASRNSSPEERKQLWVGTSPFDPFEAAIPKPQWFEISNGHTAAALREWPSFEASRLVALVQLERGRILARLGGPGAVEDGEITLEQAGRLVFKSKATLEKTTPRGGIPERPSPATPGSGRKPAAWSYQVLREWLLARFPDSANRLPARFDEAMALLSVQSETQSP